MTHLPMKQWRWEHFPISNVCCMFMDFHACHLWNRFRSFVMTTSCQHFTGNCGDHHVATCETCSTKGAMFTREMGARWWFQRFLFTTKYLGKWFIQLAWNHKLGSVWTEKIAKRSGADTPPKFQQARVLGHRPKSKKKKGKESVFLPHQFSAGIFRPNC